MGPDGPRLDFFGIGGIKCASTWLAQCLDEHPHITVVKDKESNVFARKLEVFDPVPQRRFGDKEHLRAQLQHARPGDLLGDFSVKMMHNVDDAPRLVHDHNPDARILVILRDPVKRAWSHYWHHARSRRGQEQPPPPFIDALGHRPFLLHSQYHAQLTAWLDRFPLDAFHVTLDLDLKADPLAAVRSAYGFLGVDPNVTPASLERRLNPPTARRGIAERVGAVTRPLRRLGLGLVVDLAGRAGGRRLQNRLDRRPAPYPALDPESEAAARAMLLDDIVRLEGLLGRDLGAWKRG